MHQPEMAFNLLCLLYSTMHVELTSIRCILIEIMFHFFVLCSNGTGVWSNEGCVRESGDLNYSVCLCNHLTNFAILMQVVPLKVSLSKGITLLKMHQLHPHATPESDCNWAHFLPNSDLFHNLLSGKLYCYFLTIHVF